MAVLAVDGRAKRHERRLDLLHQLRIAVERLCVQPPDVEPDHGSLLGRIKHEKLVSVGDPAPVWPLLQSEVVDALKLASRE